MFQALVPETHRNRDRSAGCGGGRRHEGRRCRRNRSARTARSIAEIPGLFSEVSRRRAQHHLRGRLLSGEAVVSGAPDTAPGPAQLRHSGASLLHCQRGGAVERPLSGTRGRRPTRHRSSPRLDADAPSSSGTRTIRPKACRDAGVRRESKHAVRAGGSRPLVMGSARWTSPQAQGAEATLPPPKQPSSATRTRTAAVP